MNNSRELRNRLDKADTPARKSGPRKLSDILPQLMARRGYANLLVTDQVQQVWQQVSGSLGEFSRAGQLRRGVLEVIVSNSVVRQELAFQKVGLLRQVQEALPDQQIRDLRFTVSKIE